MHCTILLQCILLFLSILEAIVIIARNDQSFHITRILRPVFLLDTLLLTDAKRYVYSYVNMVDLTIMTIMIMHVYVCFFLWMIRVIHHIQKLLGPIIDILCFIFFVISLIGASGLYTCTALYVTRSGKISHVHALYYFEKSQFKTFG